MRDWLIVASLVGCNSVSAQAPEPIDRQISAQVTVERDLVYASYGARALRLDLHRPAKRGDSPLPAIVVIRGGGWLEGDKEAFGPMAAALAERGFAAVSIEYRASGEAVFPAAVEDTKAAVRWIRANAAKYGLDGDSIGAIGGSAGAHLALYLGVTADSPGLEGEGGNPSRSSAVSAVVGLAAPGDFVAMRAASTEGNPLVAFLGTTYEKDPALWAASSPITHIGSASPPALLIQSEADDVVPFGQALRLAQAFGAAGVPVELVLIPGAPHAFWNFEPWFGDTMNRAAAFFRAHL
jgi:acetyl esterase/lipase